MPVSSKKNTASDFDVNELLTQQKSHDEDIARLKDVATKVDTPEHFAHTFEEVFSDSKTLDDIVKLCIREMLRDDIEVRDNVVELIKQTDRLVFRSGAWKILQFIIISAAGAIILLVAQKLFGVI
ncbi:MAG: hypothetical protein LBL84_01765 [Candidatus Nomurabacteria bacterium]|jgi:ribosomal protein L16 Arg81 hydroxylase|nr:hypothetical protein [Candidatus Nomurabacteria bacterium]